MAVLFFVIMFLAGCQSSVPVTATSAPTVTPSPTRELPVTAIMQVTAAATVALVENTPTPYPSPPPTATPIAYTIQKGDTLLAIAIDHQTTTEAIEALNPEVDARMLSIGQIIILPSPSGRALAIVESSPIEVSIAEVTSYWTPLDGLWLLGEVHNDSDTPIANVQIEVSLLAPSGETAVTQTAWAATAVISPNQTAPFGTLFTTPPVGQSPDGKPLSVLTIVGGESVNDLGDRYVGLTAVNPTLEIVEEGVSVNGRLRNSGTLSATQISLTTSFYDADGAITGYDYRLLGDGLLPEMEASFSFIAVPPGDNTTTFTITAQGKIESTESE